MSEKEELVKYNALYTADKTFQSKLRLLQSKWRENKKYPIGKSQRGTI